MEANVVDAVVRGDIGPQLLSQAAALNWDATAPATVWWVPRSPAGQTLPARTFTTSSARNGRAALSDVHGTWLVAIVSGQLTPTEKVLGELLEVFADEPGGDRARLRRWWPRPTTAPARRSRE